jgi:hypothetical protein
LLDNGYLPPQVCEIISFDKGLKHALNAVNPMYRIEKQARCRRRRLAGTFPVHGCGV